MTEWYNPIVAIGTLLSAIVTVGIAYFLYLQSKNLTKQTKNLEDQTLEMKNEISNRMRPWIRITDAYLKNVRLENGDVVSWDRYIEKPNSFSRPLSYSLRYTVENIGKMPSKMVFVKTNAKFEKLTKSEIWENKDLEIHTQPLTPNESMPFFQRISKEEYDDSLSHPLYLSIHVGYLVDDKIMNTLGKIWKYDRSVTTVDDYWIDEPE